MTTFAAFALLAALHVASASPSDWVGAPKCGECHEAELEAWRKGPHSKATASLGRDKKRRECLGCHATGEAPAGIAVADGVGCEACHGAGAGYAADDIMRDPPLREALGLVALSDQKQRERVCRRCHQQELRLTPFSVADGWSRLPHSRSAKAEKPQ